MRTIRCPYCRHEFQEHAEKIHENGETIVIKGLKVQPLAFPETKKYVDLVCPNCRREIEFCLDE